jgi:triosephosphate isomerase
VILGHSERRQYFGETDAIVNRKAKAALASSLHPIICVGETLQEREGGKVEEVITTQVKGSLAGLSSKELLDSVIAYEPVWAIGTGKTATSQQAQDVHANNAKELFGMPDIDGGLIGGAALDAKSFIDIVRAAV